MLGEQAGIEDLQCDWGSYPFYRDDIPERVREGIQNTDFEDEWKVTRGVAVS